MRRSKQIVLTTGHGGHHIIMGILENNTQVYFLPLGRIQGSTGMHCIIPGVVLVNLNAFILNCKAILT